MGTSEGLTWLQEGRVRKTFTVDDGLPSNVVRSLLRDHSGSLWIGTDAGPAKLENGTITQPPALRRTLHALITSMGEDREGRLYFGTEHKGVYSYRDGEMPRPLKTQDSPPTRAAAFYTDRDGFVWIATIGNGLKLLRNGAITGYVTRDGLFDNSIFSIIEDTPDRLWLACSIWDFCREPYSAIAIRGRQDSPAGHPAGRSDAFHRVPIGRAANRSSRARREAVVFHVTRRHRLRPQPVDEYGAAAAGADRGRHRERREKRTATDRKCLFGPQKSGVSVHGA